METYGWSIFSHLDPDSWLTIPRIINIKQNTREYVEPSQKDLCRYDDDDEVS